MSAARGAGVCGRRHAVWQRHRRRRLWYRCRRLWCRHLLWAPVFGSAAAAAPPQPLWRAALAPAARLFGAPSRTKRLSSSRGARRLGLAPNSANAKRDQNQRGGHQQSFKYQSVKRSSMHRELPFEVGIVDTELDHAIDHPKVQCVQQHRCDHHHHDELGARIQLEGCLDPLREPVEQVVQREDDEDSGDDLRCTGSERSRASSLQPTASRRTDLFAAGDAAPDQHLREPRLPRGGLAVLPTPEKLAA